MKPYLEIFGFHAGTYGLLMLAGIAAAFGLFKSLLRRRGVRWECAVVVIACAFGSALLGAYLLYMLASVGVSTLVQAAREGRLFEVLQQGGMVFYGGLIGGFAGVWLGCRLAGLRFWPVLDLCGAPLAAAHALGRVGCLCAGCCYGKPCDLFFCFPLSKAIAGGVPLFPVQLFEAGCDLLLCLALLLYLRRERPVPRAAGIFLMSYAAYRFVLEFFRYDKIRGHVWILSTSQFLSIPIFLAGVLLCFVVARRGLNPDPVRADEARVPPRAPDE